MKKTMLFILLCVTTLFANANNYRNDGANYKYSIKRTVEKTFDVSANPQLNIDGMFTDIIVNEWDKQQISFNVLIEVKSDSQKMAEERINSINVRFELTGNGVNAETVFEKTNGNFNGSTSIRLIVKVPSDVRMRLETKYGDITVGDVLKEFDAEVKYGSIVAGELLSASSIEVAYGDFSVKYAKSLDLEVKYGNAVVTKADYLNAEVGYGELTMKEIKRAVIDNDYSDVRVESVGELDIENSYADAKIISVTDKLSAKLSYSDISVGVGGKSPVIDIRGGYSDVVISNVEGASFNYKLNATFGDIKCGDIINQSSERSKGYLTGRYGDGDLGKINISLQYGDIKIIR